MILYVALSAIAALAIGVIGTIIVQRNMARSRAKAIIEEAEAEAEAILKVQQATADAIRLINEAAPGQGVLTIKALEAFQAAANGKATKIIIPSELQGIAGLASRRQDRLRHRGPQGHHHQDGAQAIKGA